MKDHRPTYNWSLGTKYDVGSCIDSLPSAVIEKKSKQNIAKDEYLNLLFDFLALFVPGEERKHCCWVQLERWSVHIDHFKGESNSLK